jgi:hypothetical protein
MYLVIWHQEDEHEIIYEGDSYEEAKEIKDDALNRIGSDGFRVVIYKSVEEEWK